MRYVGRGRQWKKRAAAVVAALFLVLIYGLVVHLTGDGGEDGAAGWQQRTQMWVLRRAVGFVSPVMGSVWDVSADDMVLPEAATEAQQLIAKEHPQEIGDEELLRQEIEALLLAEQSGQAEQLLQTGQTGQGQQRIPSGQTDSTSSHISPEDEDEMQNAGIEWDADLLAEIDRENEAMRQQAQLLQEQQSQNPQDGGQTGEDHPPQSGADASEENAAQAAGQVLTLPYTMEQLGSLDFLTENLYNVNKSTTVSGDLLDAATLLSMDMTLENPDSDGPKVLIHHTHATEYFADSNEEDEATLIVGVGDYLEELLETRYGIQVIHDRTVYPYNEAYSQALKHVESILEENPTIEVFIDLHRDAGGTKKYTVNVDGKETANLMFFNGLSHSAKGPIDYLPNENQQANLAFSFQMKMAGDSLYPGLCKRNYLKAYRYNLHVLPRAVIVEVGDNNNTLQEAKNAMEPLARILHLILTGGE